MPIAPLENLLQIDGFWCCIHQRAGLIAMQKVEGSNPFSRFFGNALHVGIFAFAEVREIQSNHPLFPRPFWARVRRFRPIPPRFSPAAELRSPGRHKPKCPGGAETPGAGTEENAFDASETLLAEVL